MSQSGGITNPERASSAAHRTPLAQRVRNEFRVHTTDPSISRPRCARTRAMSRRREVLAMLGGSALLACTPLDRR